MTLRIVPTPLAEPLRWPEPRPGGLPEALVDAFVIPEGRDDLRQRLRTPGVLAVTTGQQPGLLTGPLYTIHKALSAAALARRCEARWQRAVVPIFWVAGDDHDFAEGNHAAWPAADGATATAILRERAPEAPLTPLAREPVGPEIAPVLERLAADLPPSPHRDLVLALLRRWYRPEQTLAGACSGVLSELLAPFGVVVFNASHPAVKAAQWPYLRAALTGARDLEEALVTRHQELLLAGRDPGVTVGDGATLVMYEGRLGRDRLMTTDGGFVTRRGQEHIPAASLDVTGGEAGRYSPNVLLRPAIESALLPTVGYVAGPGELRYLALAGAIYPTLGILPQATLPRWSGILVDPKVDRVLEKFGGTLAELLEPGRRLEARVVRDQLPREALDALATLREAITANYAVLGGAAAAIDPTIEKTLQNLSHQALNGVHDAERRLVGHLGKRQAVETQQIARARELVLPDGKPQERVHTVAPWLARHGAALLDLLMTEITHWYQAGLEGAPASR